MFFKAYIIVLVVFCKKGEYAVASHRDKQQFYARHIIVEQW